MTQKQHDDFELWSGFSIMETSRYMEDNYSDNFINGKL